MPYWRCFYHVIWATKHREASITPLVETILFTALNSKCLELKCQLLAANTAYDHVHVAVSIPPSLAIAEVIGQLKGASAREINQSVQRETRFHWQEGYGAITYGEKALPILLEYIAHQKEHHQNGTIHAYLEQWE